MEYSRKEIVSASKCDPKAELSLVGALQMIQDNVCCFFGELGIDQIYMKNEFNVVWVFTKSKIEFYSNLRWNDSFQVKCFITKITPVTMVVDTAFVGNDEELLLYSKIEVCLIDFERQKIRKIKDIIQENFEIKESLKDFSFERFMIDERNLSLVDTIIVRSSNIDYSFHTNNIEYIRFLINVFPVKELIENDIKSFEINYANQSRELNELGIYRDQTNPSNYLIKHEDKIVTKSKIIMSRR